MSVLASYGSRVNKAHIWKPEMSAVLLSAGSLPAPSETVNLPCFEAAGQLNLVVSGACENCLGNLHVVSMDF